MKTLFPLLFPLLSLLLPSTVYSQIACPDTPLMGYNPSPQSWSFIKYGHTPVDYNTGTARAEIPVYTYTDPDFHLPVSIGYCSNGFMPLRQTGILGLNWFLNAGGVITRQINGLPDEAVPYVYDSNGGFLTPQYPRYQDNALLNFTLDYSDSPVFSVGERETQADVFHFTFPGHSGSFHYDGQRTLKVYNTGGNNGTYKIAPTLTNGSSSAITITTGDGYRYIFGGSENRLERSLSPHDDFITFTRTPNSIDKTKSTIVSWYLSRIEAPNGRVIRFSYRDEIYPDTPYNTINRPNLITTFSLGFNTVSDLSGTDHQVYKRAEILKTTYLSSIDIDSTVIIDFSYSLKPYHETDISGPGQHFKQLIHRLLKLDSISVHDYGFSSPSRRLCGCRINYTVKDRRLLLSSLAIDGSGSYDFEYDLESPFSDILTTAVDFWQYSNGRTSNTDEDITGCGIDSDGNEYILPGSDTKHPDYLYSKSGTLTRLTYPSGGSTLFEYESHTASYAVLRRKSDTGSSQPAPLPPEYIPDGSWSYLCSLYPYTLLFGTGYTQCGGIRIKSIEDSDRGRSFNKRTFTYNSLSGSSSGIMLHFPLHFIGRVSSGSPPVIINNIPVINNTFDKMHLAYSCVRESYADGSSKLYYYKDYISDPDDYSGQKKVIIPHAPPPHVIDTLLYYNISRKPNSRHYRRGKPDSIIFYSPTHRVFKESYTYQGSLCDPLQDFSAQVEGSGPFWWSSKTYTDDYRLQQKRSEYYYPGTATLVLSESYSYNDKGQLCSILSVGSKGEHIRRRIRYAHQEYPSDNFITSHNHLQYPSHIITTLQPTPASAETITSASRYTYSPHGSRMFLPSTIQKALICTPVPYTLFSALQYDTATIFSGYNASGRLQEFCSSDSIYTCALWGYKDLYPLAIIRNTRLRPLEQLISLQRDSLKSMPNVLVHNYDYIPFTGVSKIIAPDDQTTLFEYTPYGKLKGEQLLTSSGSRIYLNRYESSREPWNTSTTDSSLIKTPASNWTYHYVHTDESGDNFIADITYYDGLGGPEQIIQIAGSPSGKGIITPIYHDALRRIHAKEYLPFSSHSSSALALHDIYNPARYNTLYGTSEAPYAITEKEYDNSPLNLVTSETMPGEIMRSENKKTYLSHSSNLYGEVLRIDVGIGGETITVNGYYPPGELFRRSVTGEDGNTTHSFTDKQGRELLLRHHNAQELSDTYYCYDPLGRLAWIISPQGSSQLSQGNTYTIGDNLASEFCYIYMFDNKNRITEKYLPGREVEFIIYDKGGSPVFTQDGNLRQENRWLLNTYDSHRRIWDRSIETLDYSAEQLRGFCNQRYSPVITQILRQRSGALSEIISRSEFGDYGKITWAQIPPQAMLATGKYLLIRINVTPAPVPPDVLDIRPLFIDELGNTLDKYYIGNHPDNSGYKYFYIPSLYQEQVEAMINADPSSYGLTHTFYGEGDPLEHTGRYGFSRDIFQIPQYLSFVSQAGFDTTADAGINGLKKYEKFLITTDVPSPRYIERAFYYDARGRIIQIAETNILSGISRTNIDYDFTGNVLKIRESHQNPSTSTCDIKHTVYTYDARGRRLTESVSLNNQTAATVGYRYDPVGRPVGKTYGNGVEESISYNIQGWQSVQTATLNNSNIYSQQLRYYNPVKGTEALYGGNISEWSTTQYNHLPATTCFTYDDLGRLTNTVRYQGTSTTPQSRFTETGLAYDKNGNIQTMQRYGATLEDNFTCIYTGNLLTSISGSYQASYTYDKNGNMTSDGKKNLDIAYNFLNLPNVISQGGNIKAAYSYLSDGTKLLITDGSGNGFAYSGSLIYTKSGGSYTLESTGFTGGRIINSTGNSTAYYYTCDHLGSIRTITDDTGAIVEQNDYYPFGKRHSSGNNYPRLSTNRYKFNGKEEQTTGRANYLDYGARMYDNEIGRWLTIDPSGEKYYGTSSYVYCMNNPVKFVDPDGRDIRVAKEYQKQFINDLRNVFGYRTDRFSFNENETLLLDGKVKDFTQGMTKDQKQAFKGLNKAMSDKQVTSVVYADNYSITVSNEIKSVDVVQEYGGGLYSKTDNLIVIAPNVGSVDVTLDQIQITANGLGFTTENVQQNTTSALFHEIGERNTTNTNFRGAVIDFENYARRVIGLPVRPYDLNHSKTIKTNYTK